MLGPTSEDIEEKDATETTTDGLDFLCQQGSMIVPAVRDMEITSIYAGLRAVSSTGNYDIQVDRDTGYAQAVGIRSTGLSASMAIAEYLLDKLGDAGLGLRMRTDHRPPEMSRFGATGLRPHCDPDAIAADPNAGRIACFCELVTVAELETAMRSTIPPVSIQGIRRRTRATGGRCQGFYCLPTITDWVEENTETPDRTSLDRTSA